MQSQATKSAQSSANAAQTAAEERARADLAPYNTQGQAGLTASTDLLGLNGPDAATAAMANFRTSPGYGFALDQGLRAIDHGAASKGILNSSDTLHQEQTFGTGLADKAFGDYYNRLFSLANLGENAAAKNGANAVTTGQGIAGTDVSSGAQEASIYGNAAKGLGTAANTLFNNPGFQSWAGGSTGSSSYDPSVYGNTAGGAGTGTLQSLGFYTPLKV
jgi:hypothetical protein